jgi:uncharacterized protein (TIGR02996 family)
MSDRDALIRACLDNPAEDAPRLMLSDWHQESGCPILAATLREPGWWRVTGLDTLAWVTRHGAREVEIDDSVAGSTPDCAACGCDAILELLPNPYRAEIHGETVYEWQCEACYQNRLDDI